MNSIKSREWNSQAQVLLWALRGTLLLTVLGILAGCGGGGGDAAAPSSTVLSVVVSPQNQSVKLGDTVTFSVTAQGTMPLSYQWYDNGAAIAGATQARYTIAPASKTMNDQHRYWVVVSNNANPSGVTSQAATLNVAPGPGIDLFAGGLGGVGNTDGLRAAARFNHPTHIAVDSAGNLYVSDGANNTIRKITSTGMVTTFAGSAGQSGSTDGRGSAARFYNPSGIAVDSAGNVYVADGANNAIRKITPAGVVTTLAGTAAQSGSADGIGSAARFNGPAGLAVDSAGNLYVTDMGSHTIRKITPTGMVTTLAGVAGQGGGVDGTGSAARFCAPTDIAVDSAGNVFVAENQFVIRKITPAGVVTTPSWSMPLPLTCSLGMYYISGALTVDATGNLYASKYRTGTVSKITPAGVATTLAGSNMADGTPAGADGTGSAARFGAGLGLAADSAGNVYAAESEYNTIRKITPAGVVSTLAGSMPHFGSADGKGSVARFGYAGLTDAALDSSGNLYVGDSANDTIRKITPTGVVTTFAGSVGIGGDTDGTGSEARFLSISGVGTDPSGNVYVTTFYTVRKITPGGVVTTLAGMPGKLGSTNGTGSEARFNAPWGVAADSTGNVFVSEAFSYTIRKITSAGVVTTLAGSVGQSGDADGTGSAARFSGPSCIAVDSAGNIYVGDAYAIRKITSAGVVTTLAGVATQSGSADGMGTAARFAGPTGLAVDSAGNVYVADGGNNIIRKITPAGVVTTVAGTVGITGVSLGALPGSLNSPRGIAVKEDASGVTLYVTNPVENSVVSIKIGQ